MTVTGDQRLVLPAQGGCGHAQAPAGHPQQRHLQRQ